MPDVKWFSNPPVIPVSSPVSALIEAVRTHEVVLIQDQALKYYAYQSSRLRLKPWFAKLSRLRIGTIATYFAPVSDDPEFLLETSPLRVAFPLPPPPITREFPTALPPPILEYRGGAPTHFHIPETPVEVAKTVSIARYPTVQTSQPLAPGLVVDFIIDLSSTPPPGEDDIVNISGLAPDWQRAAIDVEIVSAFIDFKPFTGEIIVNRDGTSVPCSLSGTVSAACTPGQTIPVTFTFLRENRVCGFIRRTYTLGQSVPAATVAAPISLDFHATPPALTVQIFQLDVGRLLWSALVAPGLDIPGLPLELRAEIRLGQDTGSFVESLFSTLAQLEPGKHMPTFYGIGERLWNLAPAFFQKAYWALRRSLNDSFAIQFISDDPNIPWELMRPVPENDDDKTITELLVMTHPIARCVGSAQGTLRVNLPTGKIATIAPQYKSANDRLARAQTETQMLQKSYSAVHIDGTKTIVLDLFQKGLAAGPVSIIHFAGHGDFPVANPAQALLKLQDANLTAAEVDTSEVKLGKTSHSLVFFNACKTGATAGLLGGVGGWADTLLRRQFGGFIAPLWAVDDDDAAAVCADLFNDLVTLKMPVSQALLAVRKAYGKKSPTYLAYLFYGDVAAKIQ